MIDTPTQPVTRQRVATNVERFWLVPVLESEEIASVPLVDGESRIGSDPECDIFLPVSGVEPHHASMRVERGKAVIAAQSRMTWINNGPVREATLKPGQRLAIGPVEFRIERRTETQPPPLQQVEALQQLVAEEFGEPQEIEPQSEQPTIWPPLNSGLAALDVPTPPTHPALQQATADSHAERDQIERRRELMRELQASLHEQAAATLQSLNDAMRDHRQNHEELEQVRRGLAEMRAALGADRDSLVREREELNRRSAQVQADEQHLCTRQAELEQTVEQLEQERRDQYERENLLQQRIEESNRIDEALTERETSLHRSQTELEAQQTALSAQASSHSDLSARDTAVTAREQEVERNSAAVEERNAALGQQAADLERREKELSDKTAADQQRIAAEQEQLAAARAALEAEKSAFKSEREQQQESAQSDADESVHQLTEELDALRQSLAREQAQLHDDRARLDEESAALKQQQESLEAALSDLRNAQEAARCTREDAEQQLNSIDSAREELTQKRERLDQEREQFDQEREQLRRDQEAFAAKCDEAAAKLERSAAVHAIQLSSQSDENSDAEIADEYEVTEAASASGEMQFDEEIVDEIEASEESEDRTGLRSQLAELFGMSSDELNARARHHPAPMESDRLEGQSEEALVDTDDTEEMDVLEVAELAPEEEPAVESSEQDTAQAAPEESDEHDPIAAYMEKLLARTRRGPQPTTVYSPAPPVAPAPPKQQANVQSELAVDDDSSDDDADEASPKVPRKRPDSTLERANIDAFRDLANRSARSAVAKHHSVSLRNRFAIKAVITGALFAATVALLTANLWLGKSYVIWGFLAAAVMCVSTLDLLRTIARLQSNKVQQFEPVEESGQVEDPFLRFAKVLARVAEKLSGRPPVTPAEEEPSTPETSDTVAEV